MPRTLLEIMQTTVKWTQGLLYRKGIIEFSIVSTAVQPHALPFHVHSQRGDQFPLWHILPYSVCSSFNADLPPSLFYH